MLVWVYSESMSKSTFYLFIGYILSSIILTLAFRVALSLFLFVAILFGDELYINLIIYGVPQLIILPIFIGLYLRDKKNNAIDQSKVIEDQPISFRS